MSFLSRTDRLTFTDEMRRVALRAASKRTGAVYFLQGDTTKRIKIGFSKDPLQRAIDIALECSERLLYLGTSIDRLRDHEQAIHKRFAHLRVVGEWFQNDDVLLEFIRDECRERVNWTAQEIIDLPRELRRTNV